MKTSRAVLVLFLLLAAAFSLGTVLQPRTLAWTNRKRSGSILEQLFGDSRRMFAKDFYVKADVSFHSGYYPSIFDQAREVEEQENHMAAARGGTEGGTPGDGHPHEESGGFLGPPTDWIDRFGRHFRIMAHTHLAAGNVREILPWLRISAELDPQRIETYTVASYWLRRDLGKVDEAEQFLREGLAANPNSYEILYELGRLYFENRHDANHARNLWQLALQSWEKREPTRKDPDFNGFHDITMELAHLEETQTNYPGAIKWIELAKTHSPNPDALQARIDELRAKLPQPPK